MSIPEEQIPDDLLKEWQRAIREKDSGAVFFDNGKFTTCLDINIISDIISNYGD